MTKTKLEIIGEYRKDHPGPFCSRNRSKITVHSVRGEYAFVTVEGDETPSIIDVSSIFCAREVPVPREFWVNEYSISGRNYYGSLYDSLEGASQEHHDVTRKKTVHLREVLPGECE